jgi:hypothetical protein
MLPRTLPRAARVALATAPKTAPLPSTIVRLTIRGMTGRAQIFEGAGFGRVTGRGVGVSVRLRGGPAAIRRVAASDENVSTGLALSSTAPLANRCADIDSAFSKADAARAFFRDPASFALREARLGAASLMPQSRSLRSPQLSSGAVTHEPKAKAVEHLSHAARTLKR